MLHSEVSPRGFCLNCCILGSLFFSLEVWKSRGVCVSLGPTVLEGAWATIRSALPCWFPNPQVSTEFIFCEELTPLACPHSLDRNTLGFPIHLLLLSLLILEEIGNCVFNHWVWSLRQDCWWIGVEVNLVVGIPPFLAVFQPGIRRRIWGTLRSGSYTSCAEQPPVIVIVVLSLNGAWLCNPMNCNTCWAPWDPPGKNSWGGCHALLQGIFPTQGSNPCLSCIGR